MHRMARPHADRDRAETADRDRAETADRDRAETADRDRADTVETRCGARPGTPALDRRLRDAPVAWLSTTRPDGGPSLVPVWFLWDGQAFLVFSKPSARKVANIASEPRVVLAIGEPHDDFDVQLVEGRAELLDEAAEALLPASLGAKYRSWLAAIGLGLAEFAATYRQPIRITPTRFLPWRGRSWLATAGA